MAEMENTVGALAEESAADDAQQAQGESLSTITGEPEEGAQQEPQDAGWFKQRISSAVSKAVADAEARITARYEAQIAELQTERLERQAQDLVHSGEFKSLERAKEYLRLKTGAGGLPQAARVQDSDDGQAVDPVVQAKADMLAAQARKIQQTRGLDVMAAYNGDQEIQRKLASGEWDFYDVAEMMEQNQSTPAPARRSNGAHNEPVSIRNMTEKQWRELNRRIDNGGRFRAN